MAASLFCEHKRLKSVCPLCGSARAGAATPMRGPIAHDVDDTIHAFRHTCHGRLRDYLTRVHEGEAPPKAFAASYDPLTGRGRVASEEEDPATFRGGLYAGLVKMFDISIDDRRIQGYNGLADWEEMRDYVFRKFSPVELSAAVANGRLKIHGGNGAWPRQQIATELVRSDKVREAAMLLVWGANDVMPADASDDDIVDRLAKVDALSVALRGKTGTVPFSSKLLHVFAPARWPALTPRATPDVGEELGVPIPDVGSPKDYLRFAEAMRELARAKKHADLGRTDMLVADTWDMLHGE
ncbi:MAG: hypothetical protein WDA16_04675 [Candidatus Thermoplasmatota archaeon]